MFNVKWLEGIYHAELFTVVICLCLFQWLFMKQGLYCLKYMSHSSVPVSETEEMKEYRTQAIEAIWYEPRNC